MASPATSPSEKAAHAALVSEIAKPHELKHTTPVVHDSGLAHAKLEKEIQKGAHLKHVQKPSDDLNKQRIADMFEAEKEAVVDPRDAQKEILAEVQKPHELKHTTTVVHDQGLAQAKLEREIKGGRRPSLKHVASPKEGLSKEQLATLLEEEKAGKPAAAPAPAAAAKA